jgi:hypothetical protein
VVCFGCEEIRYPQGHSTRSQAVGGKLHRQLRGKRQDRANDAWAKTLRHSSAGMILDTCAELFDDDLDAVAVALDKAVSDSVVGKRWAKP